MAGPVGGGGNAPNVNSDNNNVDPNQRMPIDAVGNRQNEPEGAEGGAPPPQVPLAQQLSEGNVFSALVDPAFYSPVTQLSNYFRPNHQGQTPWQGYQSLYQAKGAFRFYRQLDVAVETHKRGQSLLTNAQELLQKSGFDTKFDCLSRYQDLKPYESTRGQLTQESSLPKPEDVQAIFADFIGEEAKEPTREQARVLALIFIDFETTLQTLGDEVYQSVNQLINRLYQPSGRYADDLPRLCELARFNKDLDPNQVTTETDWNALVKLMRHQWEGDVTS